MSRSESDSTLESRWASLLQGTSATTKNNATQSPFEQSADKRAEISQASSTEAPARHLSKSRVSSKKNDVETSESVAVEPEERVFTVSDLNRQIKSKLESSFVNLWIQGEISNFKAHTSGHFYFSLKDKNAQVSAVMFKGMNSKLKFRPENGMEVLVRGKVTVYEPRGNYQVFCQSMEPVGAGALQKAFEQLKEKLNREGLFKPSVKKPLPEYPKKIGVVTSPTGAAIRDILNVLGRRYRLPEIIVIPARVQGEGSATEIVRGIKAAQSLNLDVLIVGRGGGSIEDMWCFNDESVAREIFASKIPIVSAVGHEIDFTISDFVADVRAPTPSAAAELVVKSSQELQAYLLDREKFFTDKIVSQVHKNRHHLQQVKKRLVDPQRRLMDLHMKCDEWVTRLYQAQKRILSDYNLKLRLSSQRLVNPIVLVETKKKRLSELEQRAKISIAQMIPNLRRELSLKAKILNSLSPLNVVDRGYALVYKEEALIKSQTDVKAGDELVLQMKDGKVKTKVTAKES